jgi:hypothetical protein
LYSSERSTRYDNSFYLLVILIQYLRVNPI